MSNKHKKLEEMEMARSWRKDKPKVEKALEMATIVPMLTTFFKQIYGEEKVKKMEEVLISVVRNFPKKETSYQRLYDENVPNEAEISKLLQECIDQVCKKKDFPEGNKHTPDTVLKLAELFNKINDTRIACELVWCSAHLSIQDFVTRNQLHGLKGKLGTHKSKTLFMAELSSLTKNPECHTKFSVFESSHRSFYTDVRTQNVVDLDIQQARAFKQLLQGIVLSDGVKQKLQKQIYDY